MGNEAVGWWHSAEAAGAAIHNTQLVTLSMCDSSPALATRDNPTTTASLSCGGAAGAAACRRAQSALIDHRQQEQQEGRGSATGICYCSAPLLLHTYVWVGLSQYTP